MLGLNDMCGNDSFMSDTQSTGNKRSSLTQHISSSSVPASPGSTSSFLSGLVDDVDRTAQFLQFDEDILLHSAFPLADIEPLALFSIDSCVEKEPGLPNSREEGENKNQQDNSIGNYSCNNSRVTSVMLSPPSSSVSEGDIDVTADFETLFPELNEFESQLPASAGLTSFSLPEDGNYSSIATESKNVVRVNTSYYMPKTEAHSPTMSDSSSHSNSYPSYNANGDLIRKVPKYAELEPEAGFAVCGPMSRNAVLARENRRKKKEYLTSLEGEITTLKGEKQLIASSLCKANKAISSLKDEIEYLKSVIANETTLGALLKNIPMATGVSIKRGRSTTMRSNDNTTKRHKLDHDYTSTSLGYRPGVCLHIAEGSVSLEFCKTCNDESQKD